MGEGASLSMRALHTMASLSLSWTMTLARRGRELGQGQGQVVAAIVVQEGVAEAAGIEGGCEAKGAGAAGVERLGSTPNREMS